MRMSFDMGSEPSASLPFAWMMWGPKNAYDFFTDKTSLKADREVGGRGTIPTEGRDDPHRGAGRTAPRGATNGTGGPRVHSSYEVTKIDAKPYQKTSGLSRTHLAGTTDALGSRRTTFQTMWSTFMCTNPKGTPERERDPRTIEAPEPQPQDHARRNH